MGYATMSAPCGCRQTRIMEAEQDIWIEWIRCAMHYNPEVDDKKILEASRNKRKHDDEIRKIVYPWEKKQA